MIHDRAIDCEVLEVVGVVLVLDVDEIAGLELSEEQVNVVAILVKVVDLQLG
jgi:hypothetical protein